MPASVTRRDFSVRLASMLAIGSAVPSYTRRVIVGAPAQQQPLSTTAEAIHEEVAINASRQRVYAALTDPKQFSAMTVFSTVPKAPPATIAREVGGTFSMFGGRIEGRHVELVPGRRVVQAWRASDWPAGVYSIAHFELTGEGASTTIVFDHTGFPAGQGAHLVQGWEANYWAPMRKLLA